MTAAHKPHQGRIVYAFVDQDTIVGINRSGHYIRTSPIVDPIDFARSGTLEIETTFSKYTVTFRTEAPS